MKKITFLVAALVATTCMTGQTVLSHSTNNATSDGGTVACASNPDTVPGTGDEGISDNVFYRAYTPADFGFTTDFEVQGANFFVEFVDVGGTDPTATLTVRAFTSDAVFPAGTLTEIASQTLDVSAADDGVFTQVVFDTPAVVSSTTEVIIAVDITPSPAVPGNYDLRIGANNGGQNDPSYLSSDGCGLASPGSFADISFPDNHLILDLVGDAALGVHDYLLSQVSVYPNPATDILNIDIPANTEINSIAMYDVLGKKSNVSLVNNQLNISNFARGIYVLSLETSAGTLTKKIIKQ